MVKVITIRDEVYAELYKIKRRHGISFSDAIDMLIKERKAKSKSIYSFAGTIKGSDIDKSIGREVYGEDMY